MNANNPYQKYRALSVGTMTPGELIILLYEELFLHIQRAVCHIQQKKIAETHTSIIKAENIVSYLTDILDYNYPVSGQLLPVYQFIHTRLVSANISKDPDMLTELLPLIGELKTAWQQAEKQIHLNR